MASSQPTSQGSKQLEGGLFAVAAFSLWGTLPLYWKLLRAFPAVFVLDNRILWSAIFLSGLVAARRGWRAIFKPVFYFETWIWTFPAALLIGVNWFIYIWAVNSGFVLETSLGYFLTPLVNVVLGRLFLGEKLRAWQQLSIALVVIAVVNLLWQHGRLPGIAIGLSLTFGLYGFFKKKVKLSALEGLTLETWFLFLPASANLFLSPALHDALYPGPLILLVGCGILTALPLYFFALAAQRLRLSTIGLFQYLSPTLNFCLAVFVFKEPFPISTLVSFTLIWLALAIYTLGPPHQIADSVRDPGSEG